MKKKKNPIQAFFASVKLTLFVLFMLAAFSIIGTVIPQNKPAEFYVEAYGENMAGLFQTLDVPDMYSSWWFTSLLVLLSVNMIVCIFERFPNAWRLITMDNLQTKLQKLERMGQRKKIVSALTALKATGKLNTLLQKNGWKAKQGDLDGSTLLFAQKGTWSRLGVFVFHASIIIIFIGAMIGSFFGYKAGVRIPETTATDTIYEFGTNKPIKLDFKVKCKRFKLTYYDTGMPREFRSELAVIEDGKEVLTKSIVVNDPLTYKGLTFYQSSYEAYQKMLITLVNNASGARKEFLVPPGEEISWAQEKMSFGIINKQRTPTPGYFRYKIWLNDEKGEASSFWMDEDTTTTFQRSDVPYTISMKEFYATGLQVTKDPGVWCVYFGCAVMLLSLIVAFFFSHRRVWIHISETEQGSEILITGSSNKDKVGFEKKFDSLVESIQESLEVSL